MPSESINEYSVKNDAKIPVISFKEFMADPDGALEKTALEVDHALKESGLFLLKDHGVDWSIVENCLRDLVHFFEMPAEKKQVYQCLDIQKGRGYIPYGVQNVNAYMGRLGFPNDALERFAFGDPKPQIAEFSQDENDYTETWSPNIYSCEPPTFRESVEKFYAAMEKLSIKLMAIFSFLLGEKLDYFEKSCSKASHMLKGTYYKVIDPLPDQDRIATHTDVVPFTILPPDHDDQGLWIQNVQGEWIPARAPKGCLMVFVGECMERMTNGHYLALRHKVPFPSDMSKIRPRASLGYFVQLNSDASLGTVNKFLDENRRSKFEPILYKDIFQLKFENLLKKNKTF